MFTILCMILVVIGAFNWFSVGVFDFNFINAIFPGSYYIGARVIYGIVGVAALWLLFYLAYNKFSARAINAPEQIMMDKMMENKRSNKTAENHR